MLSKSQKYLKLVTPKDQNQSRFKKNSSQRISTRFSSKNNHNNINDDVNYSDENENENNAENLKVTFDHPIEDEKEV